MASTSANGSPIRLVCFDLGGVLIRICRTWAEGCARAGLPVRDSDRREATAAERMKVVKDYQTGRIDCRAFSDSISRILGAAYSPEEIMAVHDAWLIDEYANVGEALDAIHQAGLRTACLSNTNHSHWERLPAYPVMGKLGMRLASHELGLHKPDPAIYRAAEAKLGVKGGEIIFFDDLPENVSAARESGWHAVEVDHAGDTASQIRSALRSHSIPV